MSLEKSFQESSKSVSEVEYGDSAGNNTIVVAETFSFDRVQKILLELGFDKDDVTSWNEPIEVPFGVSSTLFIARVAIIRGFPFQHINLYPELGGLQKNSKICAKYNVIYCAYNTCGNVQFFNTCAV